LFLTIYIEQGWNISFPYASKSMGENPYKTRNIPALKFLKAVGKFNCRFI